MTPKSILAPYEPILRALTCRFAKRGKKYGLDPDDLMQEGRLALLKVMARYQADIARVRFAAHRAISQHFSSLVTHNERRPDGTRQRVTKTGHVYTKEDGEARAAKMADTRRRAGAADRAILSFFTELERAILVAHAEGKPILTLSKEFGRPQEEIRGLIWVWGQMIGEGDGDP